MRSRVLRVLRLLVAATVGFGLAVYVISQAVPEHDTVVIVVAAILGPLWGAVCGALAIRDWMRPPRDVGRVGHHDDL